ncbi:MAG: hypothetical protein R3324_17385, partial [Halobacteriales archaeon]|nr:hypothetical protein [Halobacteriales archaeon]
MTENHDLNTPQKGTSDWHIPLNENFSAIDTGIEIRDASSNRGNYTPKSGAKFLATDTETEYVGDGSSWNRVRSSGRSPSFQSAALNGEVMHAWPQTDFQVGDGDSIQDAVDKIGDSTDSAVIDITEAYDESVESRPIVVDHAVTFVGHGAGKNARVEFPTDGTPIFEINTNLNPRYRVGFSNLWIKGGSIAFDVVDAENFWTSKCYLSDQRDHGIDYTGSEFSGWSVHFDTIVHDCMNGPAWELRDAETAPNNTTMIECQARSSGDGTSS